MGQFSPTGSRRGFVRGAAATAAGAALSSSALRSAEAGPGEVGQWSPKYDWPCVAIHLNLLHTGKILSIQDDDVPGLRDRNADFSKAFVSSFNTNGEPSPIHTYVPNNLTNLFCAGHTFQYDGKLLVLGGHEGRDFIGSTDVNIFSINDGAPVYRWERQSAYPMTGGRWYPSVLALASREVLVLSGTTLTAYTPNILPQIWKTNDGGGWRNLTSALLQLKNYPKLHQLTNGLVFQTGSEQTTRFLDTEANLGKGGWVKAVKRKYGSRYYGMSVLYDEDKILVAGGAPSGTEPTKTAEIIDAGVPGAAWQYTGSMKHGRRHANATVLPDGTVLVTGGTSAPGFNNPTGAVFEAELWNPATNQWTTMASAQSPRLYHSTALLLPDGRVLSAGGGRGAGGVSQTNVEIFSPPYLFKPGQRPRLTGAPGTVDHGQTFTVQTPDAGAITRAVFIQLGSVTHTCNFNQRRKSVGVASAPGGLKLTVPATRNLLPSGYYMLFLLNGQGVPSVAKILRVT